MSKFADIQIDPAIVEKAACGDKKAHEILYRAFAGPVYSVGLRFTRVPAHAEDLLQETFIEVMRSISKFRGSAPVGAWIRRIAISKALMFLRSAWHAKGQRMDDDWEEVIHPQSSISQGSQRQEQAMDLEAALAALPPISRAVVWLHDVEGYTHREIAALMGKSESFSKSQLSRAYQRLRPLLHTELERQDEKSLSGSPVLKNC